MKIRRLNINDYWELIRLWSKAGLPFKPKGRDSHGSIAKQMEANPDFFIGAFENEKLIGAVIASCDTRKGWINRLAVDPDFRHRGVAKALIAEAEKALRRRGIRIFCALIENSNSASKELFRKCGYVEHHDIIYFSKRDSNDV
ncbi:MAG: GNAT family N-acetyltransferase [Candidatus Bathyarchaeota archaeon]|jgi:ribosomal protein S18 acetylase RimI-like enzyme|nr:GNAT family N-acetyltransferase [Candidatus Bathyarchaeota archaeon A05DMB-3]MDH7606320.1 GNAT family N-acetyltransferase [Candidatus Bathyarchaeota archaeon]